ncbi:MAG: folate-binding protein [Gammaproteobacteria bacterium]|jgi:folate-binding protein YgfZ|nr:folate-binding protein [Gammaproteobacteria bacterium]
MNCQWRDFLETRGARFDEDGLARFATAPRQADPALCDLSHLGLIAIAGADAPTFLQGQLTNDVRQVSATHSQLAGYCTHQGRMLASFRLLRRDETFYLLLPRSQVDLVVKRLRMFILRSQVVVTDASAEFAALGLSGDQAETLLAAACPEPMVLPAKANGQAQAGDLTVIRPAGTAPRFLVLGPVPALTTLWDRLALEATPVNAEHWTLLDIQAGLPNVHPETREAFVPQMTNLQLVDGVSFTKGCYAGQEVVARMQYLGKLKRRLYLGEVTADQPPRPGDALFSPISASAQSAGTIVEVSPLEQGRWALSLVAEIAAIADGRLALGEGGPLIQVTEPPYGFPAP